jgi:hypothetical protein
MHELAHSAGVHTCHNPDFIARQAAPFDRILRPHSYLHIDVPFVCSSMTRAPNGVRNGGLPISVWGSHLSLGRCEQHTTRTTILLAYWQIYDNYILIMFGTSEELFNCSILTSANAEYKNSALSPAALKQAP